MTILYPSGAAQLHGDFTVELPSGTYTLRNVPPRDIAKVQQLKSLLESNPKAVAMLAEGYDLEYIQQELSLAPPAAPRSSPAENAKPRAKPRRAPSEAELRRQIKANDRKLAALRAELGKPSKSKPKKRQGLPPAERAELDRRSGLERIEFTGVESQGNKLILGAPTVRRS